jgi:hypothetical protein
MVKTFTDETIMELHKRDMNYLREKLREFEPQIVKQQLGLHRNRWQALMRGDLDKQLKAWQLKKIYLFLQNNEMLKKNIKSHNTFRLLGDTSL